MIKKPDVLKDKKLRKGHSFFIDEDCMSCMKRTCFLQNNADVEHYEPLIKELYEALLYTNEQLEKHIYKDADVTEFGGSKLSIQREIVKALAKVEGE